MAFTTVTLTGTVTLDRATPANGAVVSLLLNTPITDGTQIVAPEPVTTRCASDGTFSLAVNANDDTTTSPTGTYYQVSITYGSQTLDTFNVVVPHLNAPTVNLFTLAQLPNPAPAGTPFVQQIIAGTGVTLSPSGGTGTVTVNSSGGGGGSGVIAPWAASTVYVQYQPVVEAGVLYTRNTAGTSAATWSADATHWTAVGAADTGTIVALGSVSGAVNIDLSQGVVFTCTLTGNTTFTYINWPSGTVDTEPLVYAKQDATGGRTITVSGVSWEPSGSAPAWDTTAGHTNAIVVGSPDNGTTIIGQGAAALSVWRRDIVPFLGYTVVQGTWAYSEAAGQVMGQLDNTTNATGDGVSFGFNIEPGTWDLWLMGVTFTNRGILTVALDGTTVGTWDQYSASAVNNVVNRMNGLTVTGSGPHTLTISTSSKNASSSGFTISLQMITFNRTA